MSVSIGRPRSSDIRQAIGVLVGVITRSHDAFERAQARREMGRLQTELIKELEQELTVTPYTAKPASTES